MREKKKFRPHDRVEKIRTPHSELGKMPLAFESMSHGTVAFGFFNIESDMLLLERCFFFAPDFCGLVTAMARSGRAPADGLPAYVFDDPRDVGDLMGAIHGLRHTGFIGAVYRRFPFPQDPAGFRQNPEGQGTREEMDELIRRRARPEALQVSVFPDPLGVAFGEYRFDRAGFHALLDYVWRGGYPRWRDGVRPDCVREMAAAARAGSGALFQGLSL